LWKSFCEFEEGDIDLPKRRKTMTLVLYYSLTGNSKRLAGQFAEVKGAALVEVKAKVGKFGAFTVGLIKSFKNAPMKIDSLTLPDYDFVDVFAPIWADGIAPPMIAALSQLAPGTKIALHLVSASGKRNSDRVTPLMRKLGLEIIDCEDIKAV
jgi:hypothetical protein